MIFLDFLKGLTYESKIYEFITQNIIQKNLSPNFIPLLAFGKCKLSDMKHNILSQIPTPHDPALIEFFSPLEVFPDMNVSIMVPGTKKGSMMSLKDFLEKDFIDNILTPQDISSIVFQIIHALLLLDRFKIMHNDFHMGNLLLQTMSTPVCLSYTVFDTTTVINTKYIVKLYDWDRGFIENLGENPALSENFSIKTHAIQKFIKNRDFYQFVCSMKKFPKVWNHVKTIIPLPEYNHWEYKIYSDGEEDDDTLYPTFPLSKEQSKKLKSIINESYPLYATWRTVNISKKDLQNFFPDTVLQTWFGEKFSVHDEFYFMTTGECTKIKILPGFTCQALYNPSKTLLYDLDDLFMDALLYKYLVKNINGACNPPHQNMFLI